MKIKIIVACDPSGGIGKNNQLLCHLPADLKYFKENTVGHTVIMGKNTYQSIGKPLPGRILWVITHHPFKSTEQVYTFQGIDEAIEKGREIKLEELWIAGGEKIYRQTLHTADVIYRTLIHHKFDADTFFPSLGSEWKIVSSTYHAANEKNPYDYSFQILEKLTL